jgi:signal transduction histidine kinase
MVGTISCPTNGCISVAPTAECHARFWSEPPLSCGAAKTDLGTRLGADCGFDFFVRAAAGYDALADASLRRLLAATGKLADGQMQHRIAVTSGDEFGRLAVAFNTMAAHIEESQLMLAKANANLETQVELRTVSLSEEIKRRQAAEAELRGYSDALESRVRERTAEIQKALHMLDRMQDAVFVSKADGVGFEYTAIRER